MEEYSIYFFHSSSKHGIDGRAEAAWRVEKDLGRFLKSQSLEFKLLLKNILSIPAPEKFRKKFSFSLKSLLLYPNAKPCWETF